MPNMHHYIARTYSTGKPILTCGQSEIKSGEDSCTVLTKITCGYCLEKLIPKQEAILATMKKHFDEVKIVIGPEEGFTFDDKLQDGGDNGPK